jgi:hypothetical protein
VEIERLVKPPAPRCAEIPFAFVVGQHRSANGHLRLLANVSARFEGLLRLIGAAGSIECCEQQKQHHGSERLCAMSP